MSKLADSAYSFLREVFPHNIITKEYYINYKNTRLFFDFYIKDLGLLLEIQGRQHDEFVKHFHTDRETFLAAKKRDDLKKEYCEKQDFVLIEIRKDNELDKDKFIERVLEEMTT
jgi:very-short-patch-repair endonuclease